MKFKILFWSIIIFGLEWAYLPVYLLEDDTNKVHSMYPLFNQLITHQTYIDYLARHIELIIASWLFYSFTNNLTVKIFIWLFIGYLIDYILTYNQPIGHFYFLPLSYGLYMAITMVLLTIREIIRS
jgi:hypothetical protein